MMWYLQEIGADVPGRHTWWKRKPADHDTPLPGAIPTKPAAPPSVFGVESAVSIKTKGSRANVGEN